MRRPTSILLILVATAVVVGARATTAQANCIPAQAARNAVFPNSTYIDFGDTTGVNTHFIGKFWDTSNPSAANEGTYDVTNWLTGVASFANYWYFYVNMGDARVVGCPGSSLSVYIENALPKGDLGCTDPGFDCQEFILWTDNRQDGPTSGLAYDFTDVGGPTGVKFFKAGPSPRPRVSLWSRSPTTVDVSFQVPNIESSVNAGGSVGQEGEVAEIRVYSRTSMSPPSNDIAGWTQITAFAGSGGGTGTATFDCTNPTVDHWLASGLVVSGQAPRFVSASTRISCLVPPDVLPGS